MKGLSVEEDCAFKADLLTLVNVLVNFPSDLAVRSSLRAEFVSLGVLEVLAGLDLMDHPALNQQLSLFRDEMADDLAESNKKEKRNVAVNPKADNPLEVTATELIRKVCVERKTELC